MNNLKNITVNEASEQTELSENALTAAAKKPFVEPVVSVPVDVLEATALFQSPTVDTSTV